VRTLTLTEAGTLLGLCLMRCIPLFVAALVEGSTHVVTLPTHMLQSHLRQITKGITKSL
jgi:hypothetical protein